MPTETPDPTPPEDAEFPPAIQPQVDALNTLDPDLAKEYIDAFENPGRQSVLYPNAIDETTEGEGDDDTAGADGGDGDEVPVPSDEPPADEPPFTDSPPVDEPEVVEDLDADVYSIGSFSFPREQLSAVEDLYKWATSLPPEAHQQINALLSGQYYLVPRATSPSGNGQDPVQGREGSAPAPPPSGAEPNPSYDDYLDPRAAQDIADLRSKLSQMEQAQQTQAQVQAQEAQRARETQYRAALDQVVADVKSSYSLTDDEYAKLERQTVARQIIPGLMASSSDPATAFRTAFDTVYLTDPEFRAREMTRLQAQADQERKVTDERKRKAASVGAGSSPVARTSTPRQPKNEQEKIDLMIAEVAKSFNQS